MSKKFRLITLAALLLLLAPHAVKAQTCGSPATCSGEQNAGALIGSYACIRVQANAANQTNVSLRTLSFDGGGILAVKSAGNNNGSTTSTYSDFATQTLQYCLNADNVTGVISLISGTGQCPMTFAVGNGGKTLRIINSQQNTLDETTCAHQ